MDYTSAVWKERPWTRAPTIRSRGQRDFVNDFGRNSTLNEESENGLVAVSDDDEDADEEEYFSAEE